MSDLLFCSIEAAAAEQSLIIDLHLSFADRDWDTFSKIKLSYTTILKIYVHLGSHTLVLSLHSR